MTTLEDRVHEADANPIHCARCNKEIVSGQHYITALVRLDTRAMESDDPTVALEGVYDLPTCLSFDLLELMVDEQSVLAEPFLRR